MELAPLPPMFDYIKQANQELADSHVIFSPSD